MALIWADFPSGQKGLYGTTVANMLNGVWAEFQSTVGTSYSALVIDPDPTIGSNGIVFTASSSTSSSGNASQSGRLALPAEVTTLGLAFRFWLAKLPSTATAAPFISFRNNANVDILTLRVSTTGQLVAVTGASADGIGGSTLGTSNPVLTANAYHHVEIKTTMGAGTGALEVRVNGVVASGLTLSGLALGSNNIAQFVLGCSDPAGSADSTMKAYWKDLIVWDTTGSHVNDFQGAVAVRDIVPDADVSLNWTPSTGATGWDLIDEGDTGPNDADYISADNSLPSPAVFTMTDLPPDVVSVRAVMPIGRLVKSDGGDCTVQISVSPNNIDYDDGADRPITVASTYWWDVSYLSPDTGSAWTPTEVNSMRYKVNRTT